MKKIILWLVCLSTLILCSCKEQKPTQIIGDPDISDQDDIIICTADVHECPDGSYVSRHWPNCEFDPCPTTNAPLLKGDADAVGEDLSISQDSSVDTLPQNDNTMTAQNDETNDTDIDEIIQKYQDNETFDEEWIDMLYEIIQNLE